MRVTHNNLPNNVTITQYHKSGTVRISVEGIQSNKLDLTPEQWDDIVDFLITRGQKPYE